MRGDGFDPVFHLIAAELAVYLMQVLEKERHFLFVRESCKESIVQDVILYDEFQGDVAFWNVENDGLLVTSGNVASAWTEDVLPVHFNSQRLVKAKMKREFCRIVVMEARNGFDRTVVYAAEGVVDIDEAVWIRDDIERAVAFFGRSALDESYFPVAQEGDVEGSLPENLVELNQLYFTWFEAIDGEVVEVVLLQRLENLRLDAWAWIEAFRFEHFFERLEIGALRKMEHDVIDIGGRKALLFFERH